MSKLTTEGRALVPTINRVRVTTGFIRPSDTTQYSIGDVVGVTGGVGVMNNWANCARGNGGSGRIVEILLAVDLELITTATFRLHLFTKRHVPAADNAAFTTVAANFADYLGYIDPPILVTQAGGVAAAIRHSAGVSTTSAMPFHFQCDVADSGLYFVIVALGTYTPKSAGLVRVSAIIEQD